MKNYICFFLLLFPFTIFGEKFAVITPTTWHHNEKATINFIDLDFKENNKYIAQISIYDNVLNEDRSDEKFKCKDPQNAEFKCETTEIGDYVKYQLGKSSNESNTEINNSTGDVENLVYEFSDFSNNAFTEDKLATSIGDSSFEFHNSTFEFQNSTFKFDNSVFKIIFSSIQLSKDSYKKSASDLNKMYLKQINVTFDKEQSVHEFDVNDGWIEGPLRVEIKIVNAAESTVEFEDNYLVFLEKANISTHIQLDRSTYEPTDVVNVQVLTLNGKTFESVEDFLEEAYVETEDSVKLHYWDKPKSNEGLSEFEFPLSVDKKSWNVRFCVKTKEKIQCEPVLIEEKPNFHLSLKTSPKHLDWTGMAHSNVSIHVVACAKSSDGLNIIGEAHIGINVDKQKNALFHIFKFNGRGCAEVNTTIKKVEEKIIIRFKAIEDSSDESNSIETAIEVLPRPEPILSPSCSHTFVPGQPYYCFGWLKSQDGRGLKDMKAKLLSPSGAVLTEILSKDEGFFQFEIPGTYTMNAEELRLFVRLDSPNLLEYRYTGFHKPTITAYKMFSSNHTYLVIDRKSQVVEMMKMTQEKPLLSNETKAIDPFPYYLKRFDEEFIPLKVFLLCPKNLARTDVTFKYMFLSNSKIVETGKISSFIGKASQNISVKSYSNCYSTSNYENEINDEILYANYDLSYEDITHALTDDSSSCFTNVFKYDLNISVPSSSHDLYGILQLILVLDSSNEKIDDITVDEFKFKLLKRDTDIQTSVSVETNKGQIKWTLETSGLAGAVCRVNVVPQRDWESFNSKDVLGFSTEIVSLENLEGKEDILNKEFCIEKYNLWPKSTFTNDKDSSFNYKKLSIPKGLTIMTNMNISLPRCVQNGAFIPEQFDQKGTYEVQTKTTKQKLHWRFKLFYLNPNETSNQMIVIAPRTWSKWVASAVCVHPQNGVNVIPLPSPNTEKLFYIHFSLPGNIVKGERLIVDVYLVNNYEFALKANLSVSSDTGEYVPMSDKEKTIQAKKISKIKIAIWNFTKSSNIEVHAKANKQANPGDFQVEDIATRFLTVKFPGKFETIIDSLYICAKESAFLNISRINDTIVKGSIQHQIDVSIDPLTYLISVIDTFASSPSFCAEQNLDVMYFNLILLENLFEKKSLKDKYMEVYKKAEYYLQKSYQHQMSFKHTDSSFSSFGDKDISGNLYITAITTSLLTKASKFIYVDKQLKDKSIDFLLRYQRDDGCLDYATKGNDNETNGEWKSADSYVNSISNNTARILSALIETGVDLKNDTIINGIKCLKNLDKEDILKKSFEDQVMYAYLLSKTVAKEGGVNEEELKTMIDSIEKQTENFSLNNQNIFKSVTTSSYLLLTHLNLPNPNLAKMKKIFDWLQTKTNPLSEHTSNQVSLFALEAMIKFSNRFPSPKNFTLTFSGLAKQLPPVTNPSSTITFTNISLPQRPIKIEATGSDGCSLIQATRTFNLDAFTGDQLSFKVFNISVGSKRHPFDCSIKYLHVCAGYNGKGNYTNMAVISVNLPSPYKIDVKSLTEMDKVMFFKKYVIRNSKVDFYFSKISKFETCLHFTVLLQYQMNNIKTGIVNVYDYHDPGVSSYAEYQINNACPQLDDHFKRIRKITLAKTKNEKRNYPGRYDKNDNDVESADFKEMANANNDEIILNCFTCTEHPSYDELKKLCTLKNLFKIKLANKQVDSIEDYNGVDILPSYSSIKVTYPSECSCMALEEDAPIEILIGTEVSPRLRDEELNVRIGKKGVLILLHDNIEYNTLIDLFRNETKSDICKRI